ncbi:hypothetical protein Bhyg_01413 [Pseudolycoriella hygida]|uniref:Uncharacterized protein n=1 Tax=Pseudolycoriella hygida TaxID=35572 RepID=A0A9Q0N9D0_9DIPT|nr:hypothetical protein Bhyg_01413 [Pseudolycoriella hygida]
MGTASALLLMVFIEHPVYVLIEKKFFKGSVFLAENCEFNCKRDYLLIDSQSNRKSIWDKRNMNCIGSAMDTQCNCMSKPADSKNYGNNFVFDA